MCPACGAANTAAASACAQCGRPTTDGGRQGAFAGRRRRGWRMPGTPGPAPARDGGTGPAVAAVGGSRPRSLLGNSRAGQVRNLASASQQMHDGTLGTVVTFRLTSGPEMVTVRLRGDQAIGFAADGDWVEVTGSTKRGFIDAKAAYNHTSGAQYRRSGGGAIVLAVKIIFGTVVTLFVLAIFAFVITSIVMS